MPISTGFKVVVLENGHKVVAFLNAPPTPFSGNLIVILFISDVVLTLGVQELDSVIRRHLSILVQDFFPHIGDYSVFSRVPYTIQ